ncbi:MAG: hypothetical protein GTO46_04150 [Gemmatimonadetes bacterium]|nr:hypothetical protein [Gemmatimonadota bacterium]NIO30915.1 hypothetical protein [Gemmatimonadota bacterium]
MAAVARGEIDPEEAGPQIKSGLPWGGHRTGMYMALVIEATFGRHELATLSANPSSLSCVTRRRQSRVKVCTVSPPRASLT